MNNQETIPSNTNQLQILQDLIIDNPEFEQLESTLAQFNIFEALGAVRVELRHSDFLSYLLDPQQNHGLEDIFIKRLLQAVLLGIDPGSLPVKLIDLDLWDLEDLEVRREWQSIDILLLSQSHQFAVVIENKIDTVEHSSQLQRYRAIIQQYLPGWQVLYLYLTPEGEIPSDESYLPVSYGQLGRMIERFVKTRESTIGPDVRVLMSHYAQMLRRHIVTESEIARLCREIYRKHKTALDLIYQHIPDRQAAIKDMLDEMISNTPGILADHSTKTEVNFIPQGWDTPLLRQGSGWTPSGRILLLTFDNRTSRIRIMAYIGPGPVEIRQKLLDMALQHQPPFRSAKSVLNQRWNSIYARPLLNLHDIEEQDFDGVVEKLKTEWHKFLQTDLVEMDKIISHTGWIWRKKEDQPSSL